MYEFKYPSRTGKPPTYTRIGVSDAHLDKYSIFQPEVYNTLKKLSDQNYQILKCANFYLASAEKEAFKIKQNDSNRKEKIEELLEILNDMIEVIEAW